RLSRGRYARRNVAWIVGVVGVLALAAAGVAFYVFRMAVEAAVILGALAVTAVILLKLPSRSWAIVAAVLVAAADLSFFDARAIHTRPDDDPAPPWYASVIGPERAQWRPAAFSSSRDAGPPAFGFPV